MNIANFLVDGIEKYGEYDILCHLDEKKVVLSNVDINNRAIRVASALQAEGVSRGDVVGVMVGNIPELPELMNGIMRMGAAFLPIIFMLTPPEIRYILEDSKIRILITEQKLYPKIKEALKGKTCVERIVIIGNEDPPDLPYAIEYANFISNCGERAEVLDLSPDELAILMYTSGSTGFPKGVMLSHRNFIINMLDADSVTPYHKTDRLFLTLPMNHIYGVLLFHSSCCWGCRIFMVPWFDPVKALDIITKYEITISGMVPTMLTMMISHYDPARHSFNSMRRLQSSGAPLSVEILKRVKDMFGVTPLNGYGCTEAGPTITRQSDRGPFKEGSVGPPIPNVKLKLVGSEGQEVALGETGEIVVRGPGVMLGYWNKPEETAKALRRNGWLCTGDLGRLDKDGELYIVGRIKDLIIKGGENIDPGVSENVLYRHPAVQEAAVIGIPDEKYGEEVGAAVVLNPGQIVTEEELCQYVKESVHHFMAPKKVFIMKEFPKTGSGKILKREIKEMVKKGI